MVISTEKLVKVYRVGGVEVQALRGVDLEIGEGEFVAVVGPSGSGKSTLLNMLGCLDKPTSGKVFIDGVDTSTLDEGELAKIRREKIGFIFQQFNLVSMLTALENVALPMVFSGVPRWERIKRAEELLKLVGLEHRKHHKPSELSGGEQQRVAIARALANRPRIILGDEPTGNIDSEAGDTVMGYLEELNREGETLVGVTHDPEVAKRARRVLRMRDGVLVG